MDPININIKYTIYTAQYYTLFYWIISNNVLICKQDYNVASSYDETTSNFFIGFILNCNNLSVN